MTMRLCKRETWEIWITNNSGGVAGDPTVSECLRTSNPFLKLIESTILLLIDALTIE